MSFICPSCGPNLTLPEEYRDSSLLTKLRSGFLYWKPEERQKISAEISYAEAQLKRLEEVIDQLLGQKKRLELHISSSKALLSPIRRLPAELLTRIFEEIDSGKGITVSGVDEPELDVPLLNASHVCSQWRELIFTTNSLWSRISIDHDVDNLPYSTISCIKTILEAAPSSWSNVKFVVKFTNRRGIPIVNTSVLFDLLRPSCHLWESLSLQPKDEDLPYLNAISSDLTSLKKLHLCLALIRDTSHITIFNNLPSLTQLHLSLNDSSPFPRVSDSIWSQLIILSFEYANVVNIRRLLPQCRNLVHLNIASDNSPLGIIASADALPVEHYTLPNLKTFAISFFGESGINLLRMLTVPSLVEMTIGFDLGNDVDCAAAAVREIERMRDRSGFTLLTLLIGNIHRSQNPRVLDTIFLFPSLISLQIVDSNGGFLVTKPDFFNSLIIPSLSPRHSIHRTAILLPQLRNLHIKIRSHSSPLHRPILKMVKSRSAKHDDTASLEQFTYGTRGKMEDGILEEFRQLEDLGLKFRLYDPDIFDDGSMDFDKWPYWTE